MQVETLDARGFSEADAHAIGELLATIWPNPEKPLEHRIRQMLEMTKIVAPTEAQMPRSFVIREGGKVLAHAAVIPRVIGTSIGEITIAGLLRVCTDPAQRGRGLGEQIVRPAFDLIDRGIFPFSLFQTSNEIQPFYEKLGACVVENEIVNSLGEDPQASPFWDRVAMRYPSDGDWPTGEIDLRGPGY